MGTAASIANRTKNPKIQFKKRFSLSGIANILESGSRQQTVEYFISKQLYQRYLTYFKNVMHNSYDIPPSDENFLRKVIDLQVIDLRRMISSDKSRQFLDNKTLQRTCEAFAIKYHSKRVAQYQEEVNKLNKEIQLRTICYVGEIWPTIGLYRYQNVEMNCKEFIEWHITSGRLQLWSMEKLEWREKSLSHIPARNSQFSIPISPHSPSQSSPSRRFTLPSPLPLYRTNTPSPTNKRLSSSIINEDESNNLQQLHASQSVMTSSRRNSSRSLRKSIDHSKSRNLLSTPNTLDSPQEKLLKRVSVSESYPPSSPTSTNHEMKSHRRNSTSSTISQRSLSPASPKLLFAHSIQTGGVSKTQPIPKHPTIHTTKRLKHTSSVELNHNDHSIRVHRSEIIARRRNSHSSSISVQNNTDDAKSIHSNPFSDTMNDRWDLPQINIPSSQTYSNLYQPEEQQQVPLQTTLTSIDSPINMKCSDSTFELRPKRRLSRSERSRISSNLDQPRRRNSLQKFVTSLDGMRSNAKRRLSDVIPFESPKLLSSLKRQLSTPIFNPSTQKSQPSNLLIFEEGKAPRFEMLTQILDQMPNLKPILIISISLFSPYFRCNVKKLNQIYKSYSSKYYFLTMLRLNTPDWLPVQCKEFSSIEEKCKYVHMSVNECKLSVDLIFLEDSESNELIDFPHCAYVVHQNKIVHCVTQLLCGQYHEEVNFEALEAYFQSRMK